MDEPQEPNPESVRRAARIPLVVTATGTGHVTEGLLVAVLAADLDAYEQVLAELSNFTAKVASTAEDGWVEEERELLGPEADALWRRITWLAQDYDAGVVPDA